MSLFSGPLDSVLAPLSLLGPLDELPLPGFASHVAIELWEDPMEAPKSSGSGSGSDIAGERSQQTQQVGNATAADVAAPEQRFMVRLTYDGRLVEASTACPGGLCRLDQFLDSLEAKAATECKVEANADGSTPTWDIDASCCENARRANA